MRALGCGGLAAGAFVLIAVVAIWRAGAPGECPDRLPNEAGTYEAVGTPMAEPRLEGVEGPMETGTISFGFSYWTAYLPPGTAPAASGDLLPPRIVLDCYDGTFQAFQRDTQ